MFVGLAPNLAAKLSEIRTAPYTSWITHGVYSMLNDTSKFTNGENMWLKESRTIAGETWTCYKSKWQWKP